MNRVIEVDHVVKTCFGQPRGLFRPKSRQVHALKNISLSLYEGKL